MLKREIKYVDFNDEEQVGVFYFNLSKNEVIEKQVAEDVTWSQILINIVEEKDIKNLLKQFKEIILWAYGKKSEDGQRFIKSEELSHEFSQSAAFEALYTELATNEDAAATFMNGIMPKDLDKLVDQDKPIGPPKSSEKQNPEVPPTT